jgi:hypothetical protein
MSDIRAALIKRYQAPEWATFWEVGDGAGFNGTRRADMIAMNTWPSRGLRVVGCEVKASRADFLRELRDPAKSAPLQRYCDYWYIVAENDKVAKPDDLPPTWGLLVLRGASLYSVKEAPTLMPDRLDRGFVACLLRSATKGMVPATAVEELVAARCEDIAQARVRFEAQEAVRLREQLERIMGQVATFEKAAGISIADPFGYRHVEPEAMGAALRLLASGRLSLDDLERAHNLVSSVASSIETVMTAAKQLRVSTEEPQP